MRRLLDEIYKRHNNHDLILNQTVIEKIGLVVEDISFKHGTRKVPCIIYSTSMTKARLLAKIDESFLKQIKEFKNKISLRFTFKEKNKRQNISFSVNSKIVYYEKYECERPEIYFLSIEFTNKPPDDLIEILGNHIEHQLALQKRAIQRYSVEYSLENEDDKTVENYFFFDGRAKRCIVTEISLFSAKILITGVPGEFKEKHSSMLIMKTKHLQGLGEMMGYIGRVELINKREGLFSVIIIFDQEVIPPVYKMWVVDCVELIVNKP
ncbi:MAG: hypothetical protein JXR64_00835 [Spirochaetales bacterium]|nr:hypothetical protein [Spirochaetales bacterium]